jgi:hypothetical protein
MEGIERSIVERKRERDPPPPKAVFEGSSP